MTDLSLLPPSAVAAGEDLQIGGCSLRDLAGQFGTPAYVLDEQALRARAREYRDALATRHPRSLVCFATKAYPSASVIRVLAGEGLGCDVVGAGELRIALAAGVAPSKIVMHGNAKTDDDIQAALDARIGYIAVDGFDDIDRLARLARLAEPDGLARPRTAVLLRVNPAIDSPTHAALATGGAGAKFGVPLAQVPEAIARMRAVPATDLRGLHVHLGSQIMDLEQFEEAVAMLARLERFGVYDFGGGLGVRYVPGDEAPSVDRYVGLLVAAAHRHLGEDIEILIEPGRSVVAAAGVTLYRVVTVKRSERVHVAVDGGMGDNLEPSLYGQRFSPLVVGRWDGDSVLADLVGRHCESGDVITSDVWLCDPEVGDLVVVPVTGAYCFTMSNNYNAALRPPVVLCADGRARLAVRRETWADLFAREAGLGDEALESARSS
jgi:diaminopimelate decarboxylase